MVNISVQYSYSVGPLNKFWSGQITERKILLPNYEPKQLAQEIIEVKDRAVRFRFAPFVVGIFQEERFTFNQEDSDIYDSILPKLKRDNPLRDSYPKDLISIMYDSTEVIGFDNTWNSFNFHNPFSRVRLSRLDERIDFSKKPVRDFFRIAFGDCNHTGLYFVVRDAIQGKHTKQQQKEIGSLIGELKTHQKALRRFGTTTFELYELLSLIRLFGDD